MGRRSKEATKRSWRTPARKPTPSPLEVMMTEPARVRSRFADELRALAGDGRFTESDRRTLDRAAALWARTVSTDESVK